jgi:hypothetical protein
MCTFIEIEGVFYRRSAFEAFHFIEETELLEGELIGNHHNGFSVTGRIPDQLSPTGRWEFVGYCAGTWHRIDTFDSLQDARHYAQREFHLPT